MNAYCDGNIFSNGTCHCDVGFEGDQCETPIHKGKNTYILMCFVCKYRVLFTDCRELECGVNEHCFEDIVAGRHACLCNSGFERVEGVCSRKLNCFHYYLESLR